MWIKARYAVNTIFFLNGFAFASWTSRAPEIQELFRLALDDFGFLLLSSSLGSVVSMPISGFLIHKFGSKIITISSGLIFSLCVLLFIHSPSIFWLYISFIFMGSSVGSLDVAMNSQAVEIEKGMNKNIMSFFHALFSVGMMTGAAVSALIQKHFNLSIHLSIVGLLSITILVIVSSKLIPETEIEEKDRGNQTNFSFPKTPIILLGLIAFCCMLGEGAMAEWTANYLTEVGKATKSIAALGLFSFSSAMAIGRFMGDKARYIWSDDKLLTYGGMLASLGIAICVFLTHVVSIFIGLFFVGLGLSTIVPIAYSQAGNIKGVKPGVGISMVTTIGYTGFLAGPPLIGLFAEYYGLNLAWLLILALFCFMLILVYYRNSNLKGNSQPKQRT